MKTVVLALVVFVAATSAFAQDYGLFHGTWFHATFLEVLKKTSSVESAMNAKGDDEPLYLRIDSTHQDGKVSAGMNLGGSEELLMLKTSIPNAGMKWAIGTMDHPFWIVTVDERAQSYIALTKIDSMEGKPVVLGRLPSRNQDPMFILKRMINASVLSGSWVDAKGKETIFSNGMVATMGGSTFPYDLSINASTYTITLTSTEGKPKSYIVQRMGDGLTLTPLHGSKTTQQPIALKRKTS
jgi:hypothetical protein